MRAPSLLQSLPHQALQEVVDQQDKRLFADSAYRSDKIESYLWLKKCKSFIHEKAYRSKPLTYAQERANAFKSKARVKVEHMFGYKQLVRPQRVDML